MRNFKRAIVSVAFIFTFAFGIGVATTTILSQTGCAPLTAGQDALLVRAEQVEQTSFAITNAFVTIEDQNQAMLEGKFPGIHAAAEKVRTVFPPALRTLRAAIDGYRKAKVKDANSLALALSVVESVVEEAQTWIAKSQGGA